MHRVVTTEVAACNPALLAPPPSANVIDAYAERFMQPDSILPDLSALISDLAAEPSHPGDTEEWVMTRDSSMGLLDDGLLDDFFSCDSPLPSSEPLTSSGLDQSTETLTRLEGLMHHVRQQSAESAVQTTFPTDPPTTMRPSLLEAERLRSTSTSSANQPGSEQPASLLSELQRIVRQQSFLSRTAEIQDSPPFPDFAASSGPSSTPIVPSSLAPVTTAVNRVIAPQAGGTAAPARRASKNRVTIRNGMFAELERALVEKKDQCESLEKQNEQLRRRQRIFDLCIQVTWSLLEMKLLSFH